MLTAHLNREKQIQILFCGPRTMSKGHVMFCIQYLATVGLEYDDWLTYTLLQRNPPSENKGLIRPY